jgi:hypothetical protein
VFVRIYRIRRCPCQPSDGGQGGTSRKRAALTCEEQIMRDEAGRKVETAVEARAGFLDRPVLVVLCASLTLGVIVLGALWLGLFMT